LLLIAVALPLTVPRLLTIDSDLAMKSEGRTEWKLLRMGELVQMGYNEADIAKRCEKKWDENRQEWVYKHKVGKRHRDDYFNDLFGALTESIEGNGKVIMFGDSNVQKEFGTKHLDVHIKNCDRKQDGLIIYASINLREFNFELTWESPLFALLVVRGDGMVLLNSYEYETPEDRDFEKDGFFNSAEFDKSTIHPITDIEDRVMRKRTV
jgi:hypothetical protein